MWNKRWKPIVFVVLIAAVVGAVVVEVRDRGYLQQPELWAYDLLINARRSLDADKDAGQATPVVIVGMNEDDIARFHYPVSDGTMAELLEKILAAGPRAIGVDIYRDYPIEPGHARLAQTLRDHDNVVMIMKAGSRGIGVAPPEALRDRPGQVGISDMVEDPDGVLRRGVCYINEDDGRELDTLSYRVAILYLGHDKGPDRQPIEPAFDESGRLHLGRAVLAPLEKNDGGYVNADTGGYQFLLDYRSPKALRHGGNDPAPFPIWTFSEVLDGKADSDVFKDKVVLVGMTAPSVKDYFTTPVRKSVFGVVTHGYAVDQLIRGALHGGAVVTYWTDNQKALWILLWSAVGALIGSLVRSPLRFGGLMILGILALLFTAVMAFRNAGGGIWIPLVPPALAMLVSAAAATSYMVYQEGEQRAAVMQLFSRHVSPDFARIIWERRDELLLGGRLKPEKLTATVLFTDLKNFTHVSESMDPSAVMQWLNDYMDHMARIVKENGGVVAKYVGDAVMAVFGVPVARPGPDGIDTDATNAVRCALQMREQLRRLNQQWTAANLPTTGMRIGIHTGPLVSGSFGGKDRLEFTVIGDTVNTASRLESYDKSVMAPDIAAADCRILVSQVTREHLRGRFVTRFVEDVKLSGKEVPIAIYGVVDYASAEQVSGEPAPSKTMDPVTVIAKRSAGKTQ